MLLVKHKKETRSPSCLLQLGPIRVLVGSHSDIFQKWKRLAGWLNLWIELTRDPSYLLQVLYALQPPEHPKQGPIEVWASARLVLLGLVNLCLTWKAKLASLQ